jgi:hypothetical protein
VLTKEEDGKAYCLCCLMWEYHGGWTEGIVGELARHVGRSEVSGNNGEFARVYGSDMMLMLLMTLMIRSRADPRDESSCRPASKQTFYQTSWRAVYRYRRRPINGDDDELVCDEVNGD